MEPKEFVSILSGCVPEIVNICFVVSIEVIFLIRTPKSKWLKMIMSSTWRFLSNLKELEVITKSPGKKNGDRLLPVTLMILIIKDLGKSFPS